MVSTPPKRSTMSSVTGRADTVEKIFIKSLSGGRLSTRLGLNKEIPSLSKNIPKHIPHDKEKLYEENLHLKKKIHELADENLQMGTKIKLFEEKHKKIENFDPSMRLISSLKKQIKIMNLKITEKENENFELKKMNRITNINELEIVIQTYHEECKRLMHHLTEFAENNKIPKSSLDYEKEIYKKNLMIDSIKKENYSKNLEINALRQDLQSFKEKSEAASTSSKKKLKQPPARMSFCAECEKTKKTLEKLKKDSEIKEKQNFQILEDTKALYSDTFAKLEASQSQNQENLMKIQNLQTQLSIIQNRQVNQLIVSESAKKSKNKNPPKLFCRISQIIRLKYMFLAVFLSLLDKNNTGLIEPEDLKKGVRYKGKPIKTKYINEILEIIPCKNSAIPIKSLEEWYEKYDYQAFYSSSSDEDDSIKVIHKPSQSLKSYKPLLKESSIDYILIKSELPLKKLKESWKVNLNQIETIMETIKLSMILQNLPRTKLIPNIFTENVNIHEEISVEDLKNIFMQSKIKDIQNLESLAKFLILPESLEYTNNHELMNYKAKLADIIKKFQQTAKSWKIIDKNRAHHDTASLFIHNKQTLLKEFALADLKNTKMIGLEEFAKIIKKFGFCSEDSLMYLYLLSFSQTFEVFGIHYFYVFEGIEKAEAELQGLKQKYRGILGNIRDTMGNSIESLDYFVGNEAEFLISLDQFHNSLLALNIQVSNEFLAEISKGKTVVDLNFFRVLLINDLNSSFESDFSFTNF